MEDPNFRAEYAKSSRASCRSCKISIEAGTLRLAAMIQSTKFDGKMAQWYHMDCFFIKQRPKALTEIGHFESLRYEDQEKIKLRLEAALATGAPDKGKKGKGAAKGDLKLRDYVMEYAKSGRASCKGCQQKIEKDEIRISKKNFESDAAKRYGPHDDWHHVDCFVNLREELNFVDSVEVIPGFHALAPDDRKVLKDKIKPLAGYRFKRMPFGIVSAQDEFQRRMEEALEGLGGFALIIEDLLVFASTLEEHNKRLVAVLERAREKGMRKRKTESNTEAADPKKKKDGENSNGNSNGKSDSDIVKQQSDIIFKYRDALAKLSKNQLQDLLEFNDQEIPSGKESMLDRLADGMAFGALSPCPECKKGQLVFRSGHGYVCLGDLTEWTKCTYSTKKPKRKAFMAPDELKLEYSFLNRYKYKPLERYIRDVPAPTSSIQGPKTQPPKSTKPLKGMSFLICGTLSRSAEEVKDVIQKYGGKLSTRFTNDTVAVISTKEKLVEGDKVFDRAESRGAYVVPEGFLDEIPKAGKIADLLEKKNMATWKVVGLKLRENFKEEKEKEVKKSKYAKESEKVVLKLKKGGVVDPDSGLDDVAHVYKSSDGSLYTVVLGQVDVQSGKNSFYKLQILESDKGGKYWVFRAWGRVGTTIGGNKVEEMPSKFEAKKNFEKLYAEKSGNEWAGRHNFIKVPGKMYPLELDYGSDDTDSAQKMSVENSKSALPKPVKQLVCTLFDIDSMKKQMAEFELDLTKMPLGKLSRRQIEQAYGILKEVEDLIKRQTEGEGSSQGSKSDARFIDATNRFFTLIPHDFGMAQPPILNNHEIVKSKLEMLESLLEIEVAYNLLKSGEDDKTKDPIDKHYEQLNTKIEVLERESDEFKLINQYVTNTHAATHDQYGLDIDQVFKIHRNGEDKRYKPFSKLGNKQLLWHGSRQTNMAGILSQGLRIAPPEAPVTGYMFGKGIYFADMVSKSANYCYTSRSNPYGFLILCEVALGKMYERTNATYIEKLPKGFQSLKGLGQTHPDPAASTKVDKDVEVPMGKGVPSGVKQSQLLYNEYIVYDISQVHIRYLLKVKFNYKR